VIFAFDHSDNKVNVSCVYGTELDSTWQLFCKHDVSNNRKRLCSTRIYLKKFNDLSGRFLIIFVE